MTVPKVATGAEAIATPPCVLCTENHYCDIRGRVKVTAPPVAAQVSKDAKLAQKLGQLQPFIAVLPQECMGQLASFGPT